MNIHHLMDINKHKHTYSTKQEEQKMGFIKVNGISKSVEPTTLPEDSYNCTIVKMEYTDTGKNQSPRISVLLEAMDQPHAKLVYHTLWLPQPDDDEKRSNQALFRIREFCEVFGIPFDENGFDTDNVAGLTAPVFLIEKDTDAGVINQVKRFLRS